MAYFPYTKALAGANLAFFSGTRMEQRLTKADELQQALTDNRHLKATIAAMREKLEDVRHETERRFQETIALGNSESIQLKTTIQELRNEMERRAFDFNERLVAEQSLHRDELVQLQQTIQLLRDKLGTG
jgi:CRISPR/Cas system CMR-associated protein Cmr5 small subunit